MARRIWLEKRHANRTFDIQAGSGGVRLTRDT